MIFRQAAQALLSRRIHSTARKSSSLLATSSSSVCIDKKVSLVNAQSKRDIWIWASSPSSSSSTTPGRGFADAVVDNNEVASDSPWAHFPMAPPDPIIGLTEVSVFLDGCHGQLCAYILTISCEKLGISER